jgi:Chaperone of endosialidase
MIPGSARNWIAVNTVQQSTPKTITNMTTLRLIKSNDRSLLRNCCLFLSFTFGFAWLALAPAARAVSPPPDGGYPNFTTAEGANALFSLTTGAANTAVGFFSLFSNTAGGFNTAVGAGALDLNTADNNTAIGAAALLLNTTGNNNTATGVAALSSNDTGRQNTADGAFALFNNTIGIFNTAIGDQALTLNTTGAGNTANGATALALNATGGDNTAIGHGALNNNSTGSNNTATGARALQFNTGSSNTALGFTAGSNVNTANNVICIGSSGANVSTSCFIGHIRGVATAQNNAIPVLIDSVGQLGTASSSRRFKKEITPMDKASEAILDLKPVTFHYKSDDTNTPQYGLIAEEVAEVSPDLVVRDDKGEIYTVRYDAVNAMLLNEFLKEHCRVQEQERTIAQQREDFKAALARQRKDFEATITELKKGMETVTVRLNEQAAQIQKVNAQTEVGKSVARMTLSNP